MNTLLNGPSFFSFHFFSFSIPFPKLTIFSILPSIHGLQYVENHCAHLRDIELKIGRKIPYLLFPMYYSLYNWLESMKLQN